MPGRPAAKQPLLPASSSSSSPSSPPAPVGAVAVHQLSWALQLAGKAGPKNGTEQNLVFLG